MEHMSKFNGMPGDDIYDKNGKKMDVYRKLEKDFPSIQLFYRNNKKLDGACKRILDVIQKMKSIIRMEMN